MADQAQRLDVVGGVAQRDFDAEEVQYVRQHPQREVAKTEAGGAQISVLFRKNMVLGVEAAELLRQRESILGEDIRRALELRRFHGVRQRKQLKRELALLGGVNDGQRERELLLLRFPQNRLNAHGGVLQIWSGLSLEFREAMEIENVVRRAVV